MTSTKIGGVVGLSGLCFFLSYGLFFPRSVAAIAHCPVTLAEAIAPTRTDPQWARSRWGILIQSLSSGQDLYAYQEEAYFLVASNIKLLTTAAALHQFGPDWRIQTPITWSGTAPHLDTLHLNGQGDPGLTTAALRQFSQTLAAQGIRSVETLSVSSAFLPRQFHHPTWEIYDVNFYYGAPVGGLILNENTFLLTILPQNPGEPVDWAAEDAIALRQWQLINSGQTTAAGTPYQLDILGTVGDRRLHIQGTMPTDQGADEWWLAVRDPAQYLLDTWRKELTLAGIRVNRTEIRETAPSSVTGTTRLSSAPLSALIRHTNQPSNNVYAETLWLYLAQHPSPEPSTLLERNLTQLGVAPETYALVDGSGLSRHNLVSPRALVQVLSGIAHSPHAAVFQASLPIAGASGTLRRRFQDTPIAGQVWAKTGTLTGVSALSGYLRQPGSESLIFSIVLNQATASVQAQRQAIDEMVGAIATWQTCQPDATVQ